MSNPWFRCYSDIADNYKLKMLAFEDRWHYIALLSCKSLGMLDGKRGDFIFRTIAARLGLSKSELEEVARRLAENYLIDEKTLQPVGWDERQFTSDNSTLRVRKCRNNKKNGNVSETLQKRRETVTETDQIQNRTDTDTEQKKPRAPRFNSVSWLTENGVTREVIDGWLAVRSNKGLTNTRIAFDEVKTQAERTGLSLNDVLTVCVKQSWGGFKSKWLETLEPAQKKLPGEDV